MQEPSDSTVATLDEELAGDLVTPDDEAYDEARRVWNGSINRRPAMVAPCTGVADVRAAVASAREHGLPVAVRGGGHGVAGGGTVDDGLVVDLSPMDWVRLDPENRRVRAGAGATWGDVDRETQPFGLAVPGGVVSDTGIAGLTLGGGMGHVRRKYGLSCDNLVSADVVTADGDLVTSSADEHADLFWALRGGGGGVGVVTSFEYECHPVGPEVATTFVWHRGDRAREAFAFFRDYAAEASRAVSVLPFYAWVPDEEPFPEASWGDPAVVFFGCYADDPDEGEDALAPLGEFADPIVDFSGRMSYLDLQKMLDVDYPHGRYYYWKSLYLDDLDDDAIDAIVETSEKCPVPLSTVDLWHLGGAIADVDERNTAYTNRDASYLCNFEANWDDPRETDAAIEWVRDSVETMRDRSAAAGLYVNFAGFGEDDERTAYGESAERLRAVTTEYDPENLFGGARTVAPEE
ncbi:FAD-binding oxidoreductase [Halomicrococcus gelatinilyticus]|uniref:FAD-binding oxidoreductase n=1 Tax=Halomicrococcus gelatinilyticus TaxID=1702103 RepID=UPI002E0FB9AC